MWSLYKAEGWKWHWVPNELIEGLKYDASVRGHDTYGLEPVTKAWMELPGMIMMDRTFQQFEVDGLRLEIPTSDFSFFYAELENLPEREFATGKKYYKVHGWMHCLVLTPGQRTDLLVQMGHRAPEAVIKAEAERAEFVRRLRAVNADGLKVISDKLPEHSALAAFAKGPKN